MEDFKAKSEEKKGKRAPDKSLIKKQILLKSIKKIQGCYVKIVSHTIQSLLQK